MWVRRWQQRFLMLLPPPHFVRIAYRVWVISAFS
nr:MAG TPA: hypothetical protein [Bacteriophage sp.]